MIKRLIFGALLAALFITLGRPQVGPLPGMAILPPPSTTTLPTCSGASPTVTSIGTASDATGAATVSISGVTVPANSLIVLIATEIGNTTSGTFSDSASNTYTQIQNRSFLSLSGTLNWSYASGAALSAGTITYTKQAAADTAVLTAIFASNIASSSPLDAATVTGARNAGSTTPSITSGAPVATKELFVGALGVSNVTTTITQDTGDGWAAPPNQISVGASGTTLGYAFGGTQVNAGSGALTFAPTLGTSNHWVIEIAGFKCA